MNYEQMTTGLTLCDGARKGFKLPCRSTIYTCAQCGASGCRQKDDDGCSHQAFNAYGRCLRCGTVSAEAQQAG